MSPRNWTTLALSALLLTGCPGGPGGDADTNTGPDTDATDAGPGDTSMDTATDGDNADTGGDPHTGTDATFGLDERPSNTTCTAPDRPSSDAAIAVEPAFPNLQFRQPVRMVQAPGDSSTWYLVQQSGQIKAFANDSEVSESRTWL
ncbi:MAG: hypothetical protein ABEN55_02260, partial [Bradymonadaceae bacterium]